MNNAEELKKATLLIVNQSLRQELSINCMTDYEFKMFVSEKIESYHQSRVNAISDEFKKILEVESDCKGIYLTKGTIRGSEALDAFEIWTTKLLKQR